MKNVNIYIVIVVCFFVWLLCGTTAYSGEETTIATEYGRTTGIEGIAHTGDGESYSARRIGVQRDGWELSLVEIGCRTVEGNYKLKSIGVQRHWTATYKFLYADLGLGLRLSEKDKRTPWLCHKHLLSDFSGGFGAKMDFSFGSVQVGYTLRHFSAPGDDTGMNLDSLTLMFKGVF